MPLRSASSDWQSPWCPQVLMRHRPYRILRLESSRALGHGDSHLFRFVEAAHRFKREHFRALDLHRVPLLNVLRERLIRSRRQSFVRDVHGHTMFLDPNDTLRLSWNHEYEPTETRLFQKEIEPGDVVLDIGANIGYYALLFARHVGSSGKVIAFEPDPRIAVILKRNIAENNYGNVVVVEKALSHENGHAPFFMNSENFGDNYLTAPETTEGQCEVETVRLDDFLALSPDVPRIRHIKMDIQGAEDWALRGMERTLQRIGQLTLTVEYMPQALIAHGSEPRHFLERLQSFAFTLHRVDEKRDDVLPTTVEWLIENISMDDLSYVNLVCRRPPA